MRWGFRWSRERREGETLLAPEDAARLHMGTPHNPMVITVALLLDRAMGTDELCALLAARLAAHPRFGARVVESTLGFGLPRWAPEASFDVHRHVRQTAILEGRSDALFDIVGGLVSTPLDPARPLWTVDLVTGLSEGSVLVLRVNHAVADGLELVAVLLDICDEGLHAASAPTACPRVRLSARDRARRIVAGVGSAARLALRPAEPPTPFRAALGVRKTVAVSGTFSMGDVSAAAHARGVTVTALVVTALAGAMRALVSERTPADDLTVHILLPVSVRDGSEDSGNAYSSVFVPLRLGVSDVDTRLREVSASLKDMRRAGVTSGGLLAGAAGAATAAVERLGVTFFSRRASAVVSSIRGPSSVLHVGGAAVRDVFAWAPSAGTIGLALTVLSYGGHLRIGMLSDAGLAPTAERLLGALTAELGALLAPSHLPDRG